MYENCCIWITVKFVQSITFHQWFSWWFSSNRRQAILSEPIKALFTLMCVTWPQWVKRLSKSSGSEATMALWSTKQYKNKACCANFQAYLQTNSLYKLLSVSHDEMSGRVIVCFVCIRAGGIIDVESIQNTRAFLHGDLDNHKAQASRQCLNGATKDVQYHRTDTNDL